jgi:hypothetical protein
MTSELEKIDILRARTGASYTEAKEVLDDACGDVVQALIELEERNRHLTEKLQGHSREFMGQLRHCLSRGHRTKIKLTKEGETVFEVPATLGVAVLLGALYSNEFAVMGAVGAVTAMANDYRIEIETPEEEQDCHYYQ